MTSHITKRTTEIHDCVSNWQDILVRLYLGRKHQERLQYAENALKHVAHCFDMSPPQTFGELCIELYSDDTLLLANFSNQQRPCLANGKYSRDIKALRTAMWHRKPGEIAGTH